MATEDNSHSRDGASNDRNYRGELNLDDDELQLGRGNSERTDGTWQAKCADSGKLAPPAEILSDRNGPSDPTDGGKQSS